MAQKPRFPAEADADGVEPSGDVFDTFVEEVPQGGGEKTRSFLMPYNGYVYRVGATWPAGANSAIGLNISLESPDYSVGDDVAELQGYTLDKQTARLIERTVAHEGTFFPRNYPNPQFVTDDNRWVPFYPVTKVPKATKVVVTVRNESTTNDLELQSRVSTFNFDPRQLQSLPAGGA